MALNRSLVTSFVFLVLMGCSSSSDALTFYVGGDDGWSLHPSEKYNHWSEKHRFMINDELVFVYKKDHDSVLVVNENDYWKCNKEKPIRALNKGDNEESRFKLERSGPFFFISGHNQNCEKGQKLSIIVLSKHYHHHYDYAAPAHPPQILLQPPSSAPSPNIDQSPSPSPIIIEPIQLLAHSPSSSPTIKTSNQALPSPSPSHSPSPSPSVKTQTHAPPPVHNSGEPQNHNHAPAPQEYPPANPTHHAPAPAPSAASDSRVSLAPLLAGFGLVAFMISVV